MQWTRLVRTPPHIFRWTRLVRVALRLAFHWKLWDVQREWFEEIKRRGRLEYDREAARMQDGGPAPSSASASGAASSNEATGGGAGNCIQASPAPSSASPSELYEMD